ncbi:MAG: hypothetical protein Q8920_08120 [Bacillota bacterium]|nr:hypothetical protein [Bacillota bacterium]
MSYKPSDFLFQAGNSEISNAMKSADNRDRLFHYTNFDALVSILKNKNLKFNRIDKVNDMSEKLYLNDPEIISKVFVCCFTNRISEYIPHWYMYSKDVYGIRIEIKKSPEVPLAECLFDESRPVEAYRNGEAVETYGILNKDHSKIIVNKDWSIDLKATDVIYGEKYKKENPIILNINNEKKVDLLPVGVIKDIAWDFEKETRIIAFPRTLNDDVLFSECDFLLVPVKWNKIESITITCGPWMTQSLKETVKEICASYLDGINFSVKNSKHDKAIQR